MIIMFFILILLIIINVIVDTKIDTIYENFETDTVTFEDSKLDESLTRSEKIVQDLKNINNKLIDKVREIEDTKNIALDEINKEKQDMINYKPEDLPTNEDLGEHVDEYEGNETIISPTWISIEDDEKGGNESEMEIDRIKLEESESERLKEILRQEEEEYLRRSGRTKRGDYAAYNEDQSRWGSSQFSGQLFKIIPVDGNMKNIFKGDEIKNKFSKDHIGDEIKNKFSKDHIENIFKDDEIKNTFKDDEIKNTFKDDEIKNTFKDDEIENTFNF